MTPSTQHVQFYRDGHFSERIPHWLLPKGYVVIAHIAASFTQLRGKRPSSVNINHELSFFLDRYGLDIMPRRKANNEKPTNTNKKSSSNTVSWINIQLTDDDVSRLLDQNATDDELAVDFLTLCGYGFSIGCKPAPSGDGWMAYLTGRPDETSDDVVGLSGYANTPVDACSSLLFKFHDKLGGILTKPEPRTSRRFG